MKFNLPGALYCSTSNLYNYYFSNQVSNNNVSDPITYFSDEIGVNILSYLNYSELEKSDCVSQSWKQLASDPMLSKIAYYKEIAFGPEKWAECLGDEALKEECGKAFASLPKDITEQRRQPSGAFEGQTVGQTEILVWVPGSLTINRLGELLKKYFPSNPDGYEHKGAPAGDEYDRPSGESRWVSMTKTVLPESRNAPYKDRLDQDGNLVQKGQQSMVAELSAKTGIAYEVPKMLDATACIVAHYVSTGGGRIFDRDPLTYTRLQERGQYGQNVVGCFGPAGLSVCSHYYDYVNIGVAALRKF